MVVVAAAAQDVLDVADDLLALASLGLQQFVIDRPFVVMTERLAHYVGKRWDPLPPRTGDGADHCERRSSARSVGSVPRFARPEPPTTTDVIMLAAHRLHELRAATREVDAAVMGVPADTVRRLTDQLLEATLIPSRSGCGTSCCACIATTDDGRIALTHADLAEVLGARRTTVTELLTAEVAAGRIVKARGYLQIVDLPAMRAAAR